MKDAAWLRIRERKHIYDALFTITDREYYSTWRNLSSKDVSGMVMRELKGAVHPGVLMEVLEDIESGDEL